MKIKVKHVQRISNVLFNICGKIIIVYEEQIWQLDKFFLKCSSLHSSWTFKKIKQKKN